MSHDYKAIKNQIITSFGAELASFAFDESDKSLERHNIKNIIDLYNISHISQFTVDGYHFMNITEFMYTLKHLEQKLYIHQ